MTMLERLGRAVGRLRHPNAEYPQPSDCAIVRAILEELREPTEAMIAAGREACADGYAGDPATIWRMMAIAALSETCASEPASS